MAIAFQVDSVFAAKKKSGNQNQSKTTSKNKNQNNQSSKKKSNDKKSKKKDNDNKKNNKKSKKKNNDEDNDNDNDNDRDRDNDRDNDNKKSNKKSNKKEPSLSELKKCRCVKRYIELTEGGDDEDDEEEEKPKGKKLKSKKAREKDENDSASNEDDDDEDNENTKQSKSKKKKKSKKSNDDWRDEVKLTPPDIGEKQLGPVKIVSKPAFELAQKTLDSSIVKYQDAPQLNTQHIDIDTAGIKLAENSSSTNEIPDTKINTNSEKSLFKEEKPAAHKYKYRIDQKEAIKFRQDLEKYRQAYA